MSENTGSFDYLNNGTNDISIKENYFNNSNKFALITIKGVIDTYNSAEFMKGVFKFCEIDERKILVISIKEVNYMSSTGIGAFVQINKYCREKNIVLHIMGMQKNVEEVFALLGFRSFFNFITELNDIKAEKIERSKFPTKIQCPHCNATLNGTKTGMFRCKQCQGVFRITVESDNIVIKKRK